MANILYERLANSIADVKTALNNIVPRFIGNTLTQGQFVEVGTDDKLKTTGFKTPYYATDSEIQQCGTKSKGASLNLARNDHVHPNTCPPPTEPAHIANKLYVDNSVSGLVSGVRLVGSGVQILLPKTQAAIGEVVKITGNDTYAVTTSGTTPDYAPIAVVASDTIEGTNNAWYAISGLAYVSFTSAPTAGQIARLSKTGDAGAANGKATGVSVFSPPSASDDHWSEIGHVVSNVAVNGLYPVILHFN